MSERDDGGPAFPCEYVLHKPGAVGNDVAIKAQAEGITVRDWFAGQAMAGLYGGVDSFKNLPEDMRVDAQTFYQIADAMLEARKK